MTASDLIVAAPWILFGVALTTICIALLRARASEVGGDGPRPWRDRGRRPGRR
jgi:hypothetical protein